jgi:hypothetical protein
MGYLKRTSSTFLINDVEVTASAADLNLMSGASGLFDAQFFNIREVVTLAEINSGKTLLAGETGFILIPLVATVEVAGAFTTTTSVDLEDTNGTPVAILTMAVDALTDGAVLRNGSADTTTGVGLGGALTSGAGIAVTNTGTAAAGGTSITVNMIGLRVTA